MALTFVERTIRGITQDAVVVNAADGEDVIARNALTSWDVKKLTEAEALIASDAAVTTMTEALTAYIMPNGMNAFAYYTPYLINVAAANAAFRPRGDAFMTQAWDKITANETAIADHETRITTLEP